MRERLFNLVRSIRNWIILIEAFLTRRGFRDVRNADAEELKRLYFTGPNAGRVVAEGAAIASARVDH
jgi:O-methyltransferase involved in polyketide biosynthesis